MESISAVDTWNKAAIFFPKVAIKGHELEKFN